MNEQLDAKNVNEEQLNACEVDVQEDKIARLRKSCKITMIFAIIGISLAVLYPICGTITAIIALIPIPIVGFIISLILSIIEGAIAGGALACSVIAIVRSIIFLSKRSSVEKNEKTKKLFTKNIVWLCLGAAGTIIFVLSSLWVFIMNVLEFFLSFI